jgi:hypothetical protein
VGREDGTARKSIKPEGDNLELPGHGGRIRMAVVESWSVVRENDGGGRRGRSAREVVVVDV